MPWLKHLRVPTSAAQPTSGKRSMASSWNSPGGPAGNYVDFFDPRTYYTGQTWERSQKYRINFNGIGPYEFCPVARRDNALEQEGEAILRSLRKWATASENQFLMDRVMAWAYLSETRDSFAIENEVSTSEKENAFLQAMTHLRDRVPLTEGYYLVGLKNIVIGSPLRAEAGLRGCWRITVCTRREHCRM